MADEYIRLDTTIIAIDNLINEAATGTMARTLFEAKDTIYNQQRYVIDVQPVKRCRMIPIEPDLRGYTNLFACTNCHTYIHYGRYKKEYEDNYCSNCGAEVEEE